MSGTSIIAQIFVPLNLYLGFINFLMTKIMMKFKKPNKQTVWTKIRLLPRQQFGFGIIK